MIETMTPQMYHDEATWAINGAIEQLEEAANWLTLLDETALIDQVNAAKATAAEALGTLAERAP